MDIQLHAGDNMESLKLLPDNSVDSVVTDPPYGISFMAKKWDYDVPTVELWREVLRVLKPGGHALIACGTRTQHRMAVNIEDAGFEIRDVVSWMYGSGFPKSHDISKAIDKAAGAEREVLGVDESKAKRLVNQMESSNDTGTFPAGKRCVDITAPATDEAKQWDGWGTALKPCCEFFTLCRKPLSEKTIAANVLKWGTGGINIDGCRVGMSNADNAELMAKSSKNPTSNYNGKDHQKYGDYDKNVATQPNPQGRFPANLIHDGSDEVVEGLGEQSRFFYCPKASKKDRDEGLEGFDAVHRVNGNKWTDQDYRVKNGERPQSAESGPRKNTHPTVKPTALMQYLCRMITPVGGVVLDPFMGSGSTGKAAKLEGFGFIGMELQQEYYEIAKARIDAAEAVVDIDDQKQLF